MRVAIRVDASREIGTGHFVRCLTLADALAARGVHVRFVSRQLPQHLAVMLPAKGHEYAPLEPVLPGALAGDLVHSHWLGTSQNVDAQATAAALGDQTWDWLLVDHYALDARWESEVRATARKIFVIDDLADRTHDCDGLLDQNYYENLGSRYSAKVPAHCQPMLGPRFAILRDEFRSLHDRVAPRTGPVKRVLVFLGGVDADNYTGRAIDALCATGLEGLTGDVVIGAQHPQRGQIESTCQERGLTCYVQTERMAELMAFADLAIGAGGSATWERCCLGLPTLTVSLSHNQVAIAEGLDSLGAGRYVGSQEVASVSVLQKAIIHLRYNAHELRRISEKALATVDGRGVDRVCDAMIS